ncbi:MAG: ABC transporter ATP-binding protein [Arenicella sp.]
MLKLESVNTYYGPVHALKDACLHIDESEIVTLIGANGAGKSTLLMTVCGTPNASSGQILFENENITEHKTSRIMSRDIAVVPEGRRIFSQLTVLENLHMGAFFRSADEAEETQERIFQLFPRIKERLKQRGGTLSGGEQQMLAIGRALMSQPRLLLLDEPSLGLAPIIIDQIFSILQQIRDEGMTIFLVEQNAHRALQVADRGYVLENGRIIFDDSGDNLLNNDQVKQAYLGG